MSIILETGLLNIHFVDVSVAWPIEWWTSSAGDWCQTEGHRFMLFMFNSGCFHGGIHISVFNNLEHHRRFYVAWSVSAWGFCLLYFMYSGSVDDRA